jgi:Leucine Rich repeat
MLYYNQTLVRLDLSSNSISNAGAITITRALRYNPTLQALYICSNHKLTKGGVAKAIQFLQYNESLEQVYIWDSNVSHPLCEAILAPMQSVLDYNDTIHTFLIDHEDQYFPTLRSGQTAPKKGLRRRQDIYKWLSNDQVIYDIDLDATNNNGSNNQDDDSDSVTSSFTGYTDDVSYLDMES